MDALLPIAVIASLVVVSPSDLGGNRLHARSRGATTHTAAYDESTGRDVFPAIDMFGAFHE
jgi:hypothetical protein